MLEVRSSRQETKDAVVKNIQHKVGVWDLKIIWFLLFDIWAL